MKRKGSLFMLTVIMGQFLSPMIAVAETVQDGINGDQKPPVTETTTETDNSASTNPTTQETTTTESTEGVEKAEGSTESTENPKEPANVIQLDAKKSVLKYQEPTEKDADQLFLYGDFKGSDQPKPWQPLTYLLVLL